MGSIAVTAGTVCVRDCPEVKLVLKALDELAEGMDERRVESRKANRRKYGRGVLEVEIYISGYASGSHACKIDEKIRELGPYAVEAAEFHTEWECERDRFFVGSKEQVPKAESADALAQIRALAPKLLGDDIAAALNVVVRDTHMPAFKRKCLEKSGGVCPFCEGKNITSGRLEADGPVAWAEVECGDCGRYWQDVWTLTDIAQARDRDGRRIED